MHWSLAHMAHHVNVGKHSDPATARRGETLYEFVPRSVVGHVQDGAAAELQRLRAKDILLWSPRNRMIWWAVCPLALSAVAYETCGPTGLLMFVGQAAGSVLLLEVVNYLEHWGLERKQLPSGRYEKVAAQHSWNANWIATSAMTFRLQRHADHHLASSRPYQVLKDVDEAPQLPASYPAMALLALFPGLFMDVMDPRLDEYLALQAASGDSDGDNGDVDRTVGPAAE
jgi:alkane 1-monooxygenase